MKRLLSPVGYQALASRFTNTQKAHTRHLNLLCVCMKPSRNLSSHVGDGTTPTPAIHRRSLETQIRVDPTKILPTSPTLWMHSVQTEGMFRGGFGQSPFPMEPSIQNALVAAVEETAYQDVQGMPALREAISGAYKVDWELDFDPEGVFVFDGSKNALFLLFGLIDADVLLPAPSWVSYEPQAKLWGRPVHWLPALFEDNYLLLAPELDRFLQDQPDKPFTLLLNSPNNPTGAVYSETQLKDLAKVLQQYPKVCVVFDAIYGYPTTFSGEKFRTLAHYLGDRTIVTAGMSKILSAGGWRFGFAHIPKAMSHMYGPLRGIMSETISCVHAPLQKAAIHAYGMSPEIKSYLAKTQITMYHALQNMENFFHRVGVDVTHAEGAFYVTVRLSKHAEALSKVMDINSTDELARVLYESYQIGSLPGTAFGLADQELALRVAAVDFNGADALAADLGPEEITDDQAEQLFPKHVQMFQRFRQFLQDAGIN